MAGAQFLGFAPQQELRPGVGGAFAQGLSNALPGLFAGQQQLQQNQALQGFAGQMGVQLPQGINPQFAQQFLLGQLNKPGGAGFTLGQGQQRFDVQGNPIAQVAPAAKDSSGFTLSEGQQRFDAQGNPIADVPAALKPPKPRAGVLTVAKEGDETGLPAGTVFQADPQGNIKIIREAGGTDVLNPKQRIDIARDEGKQFRADPRIADLQIIERSERGMQAALKQSTSKNAGSRIASDQALGVLFQKMLDPTSVVRESEFARTPQGASMVNRVIGAIEKISKGGLGLTDADRQELVTMAQKLLFEAKKTANKAFDEFNVRSDELNLNKKIVFGGAKRFDITEEPSDTGGGQQFTPTEIQAELTRRGL